MGPMTVIFRNMSDEELLRVADRLESLPREALEDFADCLARRVRAYRYNIDTALGMVENYERLDT